MSGGVVETKGEMNEHPRPYGPEWKTRTTRIGGEVTHYAENERTKETAPMTLYYSLTLASC